MDVHRPSPAAKETEEITGAQKHGGRDWVGRGRVVLLFLFRL
jgi:hypothetical protein